MTAGSFVFIPVTAPSLCSRTPMEPETQQAIYTTRAIQNGGIGALAFGLWAIAMITKAFASTRGSIRSLDPTLRSPRATRALLLDAIAGMWRTTVAEREACAFRCAVNHHHNRTVARAFGTLAHSERSHGPERHAGVCDRSRTTSERTGPGGRTYQARPPP